MYRYWLSIWSFWIRITLKKYIHYFYKSKFILDGGPALSYDGSAGGGSTVTWTHPQSSSPQPTSSPHLASSPHPTSSPHPHHDDSGHSSGGEGIGSGGSESHPSIKHDGKSPLLQFALQYFRGAKEMSISPNGTIQNNTGKTKKKRNSKDASEWTWKEQVNSEIFFLLNERL